jgi:hypothetical protein
MGKSSARAHLRVDGLLGLALLLLLPLLLLLIAHPPLGLGLLLLSLYGRGGGRLLWQQAGAGSQKALLRRRLLEDLRILGEALVLLQVLVSLEEGLVLRRQLLRHGVVLLRRVLRLHRLLLLLLLLELHRLGVWQALRCEVRSGEAVLLGCLLR